LDVAAALRENAHAIFEANAKDPANAKRRHLELRYTGPCSTIQNCGVVDGPNKSPQGIPVCVVEETELDEGLILKKVQARSAFWRDLRVASMRDRR
jgi:hypothetical protein